MIQHVVIWKLLEESAGRSKSENLELLIEKLTALPALIPQIRSLSVVKNTNPTDKNMDVALITAFENLADLETYSLHSEHVKVGGFVGSIVSSRAAIDYEI